MKESSSRIVKIVIVVALLLIMAGIFYKNMKLGMEQKAQKEVDEELQVEFNRWFNGEQQDRVRKAMDDIEENPNSPEPFQEIGIAYFEAAQRFGDVEAYQKAVDHFIQALQKDERYFPAQEMLGWTYILLEQMVDAKNSLEGSYRLSQSKPSAVGLGWISYYNQDYSRSMAYFMDASSLPDNQSRISIDYAPAVGLGWTMYRENKFEDAYRYFTEASKTPNAAVGKIAALVALNRTPEAQEIMSGLNVSEIPRKMPLGSHSHSVISCLGDTNNATVLQSCVKASRKFGVEMSMINI